MKNVENNYEIGIYVRESRDDNRENFETIEVQRDLLKEFVKNNNFGTVKRIYIDDNISGSNFKRAGIKQLKQDIIKNVINMIVLKDLSRLGRNNAKTLLFLDFLEEHGVRVLTYDRRYDSERDNDTVGIDTWFNERYIRDISRKIRHNLWFKIRSGEYIGSAPYGYKKSDEKKNVLMLDSKAAIIVKKIYALYKKGYGYKYISDHLNEKGYPSPAANKNIRGFSGGWNPVCTQRILSNRVYTGDTVQGVSEKISFKTKKTRRIPKDRWIITTDTHEPIISKEEFEEVQKIRQSKGTGSGAHKGRIHLLRDVLYCGKCMSKMFAKIRSSGDIGYICSNYYKNGKQACSSHYVKEEDICGALIEEIYSLLNNADTVKRAQQLLDGDIKGLKDTLDDMDKLENELLIKQKQQEALYIDKLEGKISEDLFSRLNKRMQNELLFIEDRINETKNLKNNEAEFKDITWIIHTYLNKNTFTNQIVKCIVERAIVFEKGDNLSILDYETLESSDFCERRGIVVFLGYV